METVGSQFGRIFRSRRTPRRPMAPYEKGYYAGFDPFKCGVNPYPQNSLASVGWALGFSDRIEDDVNKFLVVK